MSFISEKLPLQLVLKLANLTPKKTTYFKKSASRFLSGNTCNSHLTSISTTAFIEINRKRNPKQKSSSHFISRKTIYSNTSELVKIYITKTISQFSSSNQDTPTKTLSPSLSFIYKSAASPGHWLGMAMGPPNSHPPSSK